MPDCSQLLIDLDTPGITIRPIIDMAGHHDFNEVFFDDVLVPHGATRRRARAGVEAGHR